MTKVREALFDDFVNIGALMGRNDMKFKDKSPEEWRYLWKENPVIENGKDSWPIGWVLEDDNGKIVGFQGNIPIAYEFGGKKLIVAVSSSSVVDAAYRNYSILLFSKYFSQKKADLFLGATSNYAVEKIFLSFKANKVKSVLFDEIFFWIIDYREFISSVMAKKEFPFLGVISRPLSLIMRSFDRLREKKQYMNEFEGRVRCLYEFDEKFDLFWEKLKFRHRKFLCVRDSRALNWHFRFSIIHKKIWIITAEKKSKLTGYIIFLRQDNPKIGLKRLRLVDFQTIDGDKEILSGIIAYAMKKCRAEKICMIETTGFSSEKRNIIEKLAPHKRKAITCSFFYKAKDRCLEKKLENSESWDISYFDADISL